MKLTIFLPIVIAVSLLLLMPGSSTRADTINVCWDGSGGYLAIQEGIDAAVDGDEVVICPGTYTGDGNLDLNFSHGLPEGQTSAIVSTVSRPRIKRARSSAPVCSSNVISAV